MKKLFFIFILFLIPMLNFGQTHNTNCDCCKYSKNYEKNCKNIPNESKPCGCPACGEQKKKEEAFKKAEDKRINDAIVAKKKAEQEAKQKAEQEAYKKKMAEVNAQEKASKVYINAQPKNEKNKPNIAEPKKNTTKANDQVFRSTYPHSPYNLDNIHYKCNVDYFLVKTDTILKGKFDSYHVLNNSDKWHLSNELKFPPNIGIVRLKESTSKLRPGARAATENVPIYDLVDATGKRLLNDNNITYIMHFYDKWFVVLNGAFNYYNNRSHDGRFFDFPSGYLYNIATHEKLDLQLRDYYNDVKISNVMWQENAGYDYMRPSKKFKSSICTEIDNKINKIYYINENDQIETEIKKY